MPNQLSVDLTSDTQNSTGIRLHGWLWKTVCFSLFQRCVGSIWCSISKRIARITTKNQHWGWSCLSNPNGYTRLWAMAMAWLQCVAWRNRAPSEVAATFLGVPCTLFSGVFLKFQRLIAWFSILRSFHWWFFRLRDLKWFSKVSYKKTNQLCFFWWD